MADMNTDTAMSRVKEAFGRMAPRTRQTRQSRMMRASRTPHSPATQIAIVTVAAKPGARR